jgi:hypothetical protein
LTFCVWIVRFSFAREGPAWNALGAVADG